jgi:putative tricarboxylic transport membrane protein
LSYFPLSETSKASDPSELKTETSMTEPWADLAAGLGILLLGIVLGVGTFSIPPGAGYDRIGPRFFPSVVGAGLVLLGMWLSLSALRWQKERAHGTTSRTRLPAHDRTNWNALAYVAAGLFASLALLERGGFVIASSVLFWLAARGFESRKAARDAGIAVTLAVLVYVVFTRGLGLTLP